MPKDTGRFPNWVRDAIFYQVFPDRFATSGRVSKPNNLEEWHAPPTVHGYKGGDLLGLVEQLDYLVDLGVNAVYLNPVFASGSNHRYHTHDYFRVDPLLGGDAALDELIAAAHARGVRVVLDGVFNHASRGLLQFHDILENGAASPYVDWFHVNDFPLNAYGGHPLGYDAWWGLPALPKFNTGNPAVREFLWSVGEYWLQRGVDGWRLDVPNEIDDDEFWQEFRRRCRAVNTDAYLVGEIWTGAERWLRGDIFDGVMNYPLTRAIFGLVGRDLNHAELAKSGLDAVQPLGAEGFAAELERQLRAYPEGALYSQLNLLGSHDTPRVRTGLGGDLAALRQAWVLLFAFPGAPCVYYGDELGLAGGHDPHCRQGMPWGQRTEEQERVHELVRSLCRVRAEQPALRRGTTRVSAPKADLVLVERRLSEAEDGAATAVYVLVNSSGAASTVPESAVPRGAYRDLLSGERVELANGNAVVPARSGRMLAPLG
ncbi:MAG: glycoside hydrolase family 13 protein [Trueperaceae bacterium]